MTKLRITSGNTKTKAAETLLIADKVLESGRIGCFDLLAGHTCPAANICHSMVIETDKGLRIQDGPTCQFRCYAASAEARSTPTYNLHKQNTKIAKTMTSFGLTDALIKQIEFSPYKYIRVHTSGDFFEWGYFVSWVTVAKALPNRIIYGYSKMSPYFERSYRGLPDNFRFNLSLGGKFDEITRKLYHEARFPITGVSVAPDDAWNGMPVDSTANTELMVLKRMSFFIPVHGTQPAHSRAGEAVKFWKKVKQTKEV